MSGNDQALSLLVLSSHSDLAPIADLNLINSHLCLVLSDVVANAVNATCFLEV